MILKTTYPVDLHTHTIRSDGNDTPRELIDMAVILGMEAIAITDHDIPPPENIIVDGYEIPVCQYARQKGITLLKGYEFSCDTYVDDVHIVGLGCRFDHPLIIDEVENAIQSKINGYRELTEILCRNGIQVTWEEVLRFGNTSRTDKEVQRKHIFELIAAKGYTESWQEAKLLVRDNPLYNIRRKKVDPIYAIEVIHKTGGIAILAHPFLIDEQVRSDIGALSREKYISRLVEYGLDGIEAAYTYDKTSYKGNLNCNEIEQLVRNRYGNVLRLITGGSDYHGDGKKNVKNARMLGEKGISSEYFHENEFLSRLVTG